MDTKSLAKLYATLSPRERLPLGCVVRALPNWSLPKAVNCWLPPVFRLAVVGETMMVVKVWDTTTVTLLVAVAPAPSLIEAVRV